MHTHTRAKHACARPPTCTSPPPALHTGTSNQRFPLLCAVGLWASDPGIKPGNPHLAHLQGYFHCHCWQVASLGVSCLWQLINLPQEEIERSKGFLANSAVNQKILYDPAALWGLLDFRGLWSDMCNCPSHGRWGGTNWGIDSSKWNRNPLGRLSSSGNERYQAGHAGALAGFIHCLFMRASAHQAPWLGLLHHMIGAKQPQIWG